MANTIDSQGIHTEELPEIIENITNDYKSIYGNDINTDSDTPDGQRINIEAQAKKDMLDFATQVYNSFDVDTVTGVAQDRLYKLNNIYRQNSGYSFCNVDITVSGPVNLDGLDANATDPDGVGFTVSDINSNNWILLNSVSLTGAGTYTLEFRAQNEGEILASPNTINTLVTVIPAVTGVNNASAQYITGNNAESDANFRIRRNKSTAISGKGFYDSLLGDLLSIPLVSQAMVYENDTGSTDADGIPPYSIWVIVEGGTDLNIGKVIYANKSFGCDMKGSTTVNVERADGTNFVAKFDRPQTEPLYIQMTIASKLNDYTPDTLFIKRQLVERMRFNMNKSTDVSQVTSQVINIDSNVYISSIQISNDNLTWTDILNPSAKNKYFALDIANIDITVS